MALIENLKIDRFNDSTLSDTLEKHVQYRGSNEYYDGFEVCTFLIEPNYTNGCVFVDDSGVEHQIKFIEQDGGGEGGSEYCHTVLQIGEEFYKFEYRYYSHHGYDYFDEVTKVEPKQKTITVYE